MNELEKLFARKKTENGDEAYSTTGNNLLDLFFMSAFFEKHLDSVHIGNSTKEQIFSAFMRDPRLGMGRRDLGRELMKQSKLDYRLIPACGRYDDILYANRSEEAVRYLIENCKNGNELAKKWMPRLNGRTKEMARAVCKMLNISEKEYRGIIKCDTTESKLSTHRTNEIKFEHVPSLAMIKYYKRFAIGDDTAKRFKGYLLKVKKGEKKLNVSTTNVYDIYRNRNRINADLFFNKLEKIEISCIPILDTSGSMYDNNDSIGKASSIAHYLAKSSSYCNGNVISFSSSPKLIKIKGKDYDEEIKSMYTGNCSHTNFGRVMNILKGLEKFPDYLVVLSDMEFDCGSCQSKNELKEIWEANNCDTKIIWWNFNSRNTTCPEIDSEGNVFISGYNPMLLKYLESGFDGEKFLNRLLEEYRDKFFEKYLDQSK